MFDQVTMEKMLALSPEKCTGCRTCELACAFKHNEEFRPTASRVTVFTWESVGVSVPMMCLQCDDAACVKVCPVNAISRSKTGAMVIDQVRCIKCKMCVAACPLGNNHYDGATRQILKCDLCGGDPNCAKLCPSGAIVYKDAAEASKKRKKAYAEKFKELLQEVTE